MKPYILVENCHLDVVRESLKFHGPPTEEVVGPVEEFDVPSPEDFGLESFDDYIPHEDDEEFEKANNIELGNVDITLNYSILMRSQDQIFVRFDE